MNNFEKVSIVGNGISAWMIGAFVAKQFEHTECEITVYTGVEAEKIDDIQSPLPLINDYLTALDIDLQEFEAVVKPHPKLGIAYLFNDKKPFFHVWGSYGAPMGPIDFHQVLLRVMQAKELIDINRLSMGAALALADKYREPSENVNSVYSTYEQSWSFETENFITFLKARSLALGVKVNQTKIINLKVAENGSYIFDESGAAYECDYLINTAPELGATGERESWFKSLPYKRTSSIKTTSSHSKLINKLKLIDESSWVQEISHREFCIGEVFRLSNTESGTVYVDRSPRGHNYLKFGPAMAAMHSPLFSVLDLNLVAIKLLMRYFPSPTDQYSVVKEFNTSLVDSFENLRDVTQLCLTAIFSGRGNSGIVALSDRAKHKLELFKHRGRFPVFDNEFYKTDWQLWLLFGLGVVAENVEPLASMVDQRLAKEHLRKIENVVIKELQFAPMMSERN